MKSTIFCCVVILAFRITVTHSFHPHRHTKRRRSDTMPTSIPLIPLPDDSDRLKEALEMLNIGKKAMGLRTEDPEVLWQIAVNPNDKAKSKNIRGILEEPHEQPGFSRVGKQFLVLKSDHGKVSIENYTNITPSPQEEMEARNGENLQDLFKMEMEKKTPVGNGEVFNKITIVQTSKQEPFNSFDKRRRKYKKQKAFLRERRRKREGESSLQTIPQVVKDPTKDGHKESFSGVSVFMNPTLNHAGFWSKIRHFFDFLAPLGKGSMERSRFTDSLGGSVSGGETGTENKETKAAQPGGHPNAISLVNYTNSHIEFPLKENDIRFQNLNADDEINARHIGDSKGNLFNLQDFISSFKIKTPMENSEENSKKKRWKKQLNNSALTSNTDSSMSTQNSDSATEVKMLKMHSLSENFPTETSTHISPSREIRTLEKVHGSVPINIVRPSDFQSGRLSQQWEVWHENQMYFSGLIGACMMFLVLVCIVTGVFVFRKLDRKSDDCSAGNLNLKGKHVVLKLSSDENVQKGKDLFFKDPNEKVLKWPFYSNYRKRAKYVPLHNEDDDFDFAGLDWQSEMGEWLSDGELSK